MRAIFVANHDYSCILLIQITMIWW